MKISNSTPSNRMPPKAAEQHKGRTPWAFLSWIVIGLIAGWLANANPRRPRRASYNLAVGLVGAIVGGLLFDSRPHVMPDLLGAT